MRALKTPCWWERIQPQHFSHEHQALELRSRQNWLTRCGCCLKDVGLRSFVLDVITTWSWYPTGSTTFRIQTAIFLQSWFTYVVVCSLKSRTKHYDLVNVNLTKPKKFYWKQIVISRLRNFGREMWYLSIHFTTRSFDITLNLAFFIDRMKIRKSWFHFVTGCFKNSFLNRTISSVTSP